MIQHTYAKHSPQVRRLQGGILVPVNIETVTLEGEEGPEEFYRYKLLKFIDEGQEITSTFKDDHQQEINDYLDNGVDLQRISQRHPKWNGRRPLQGPGIPQRALKKVSDAQGMGAVARMKNK